MTSPADATPSDQTAEKKPETRTAGGSQKARMGNWCRWSGVILLTSKERSCR